MGVFLLLILISYIIYDGIRFKNYKDDIIKTLNEYAKECGKIYEFKPNDFEKGFLKSKVKMLLIL